MKNTNELIEYLTYFGFKEKEIIQIINNYANKSMKLETLLLSIIRINVFLISKGYTKEDIIKIIKEYPTIYSYGKNNLEEKYNNLIDLDYKPKEIIKMTKIFPKIYSYSKENIKNKINYLKQIGYTTQDILKITKELPQIFGYAIANIDKRIKDLIEIGYEDIEEVLKITKFHVKIYSYSIENIKQRINDLIALGYTKEQVLKITKAFPNLFGLSLENIKEKIEYLRKIELEDIVLIDTKQLIQSISLTHARYEFYKNQNKDITITNYRLLFLDEKEFIKRFKITKQELTLIYPYEKASAHKKKVEK